MMCYYLNVHFQGQSFKVFFFSPHPQPPDLLCSISTWSPSSRRKAVCDCSSLSITQVRNVWSCISTRPYVFIAKCLIKHTNVFKCYFLFFDFTRNALWHPHTRTSVSLCVWVCSFQKDCTHFGTVCGWFTGLFCPLPAHYNGEGKMNDPLLNHAVIC